MLNDRILLFSCPHFPFEHLDFISYIQELNRTFNFTRAICLGDEVDAHAMNMHDHDPDLPSAGDELQIVIEKLKQLEALFPYMDVLDSNHGSMIHRRAKKNGIPGAYIRPLNEVYRIPGWRWHDHLEIELPTKNRLYMKHQLQSNILQAAQKRGVCTAQGHLHTKLEVQYSSNSHGLLWGATVGCMIDNEALAYAYNKTQKDTPIIGCLIILDGVPVPLPMKIDDKGKWLKKL